MTYTFALSVLQEYSYAPLPLFCSSKLKFPLNLQCSLAYKNINEYHLCQRRRQKQSRSLYRCQFSQVNLKRAWTCLANYCWWNIFYYRTNWPHSHSFIKVAVMNQVSCGDHQACWGSVLSLAQFKLERSDGLIMQGCLQMYALCTADLVLSVRLKSNNWGSLNLARKFLKLSPHFIPLSCHWPS